MDPMPSRIVTYAHRYKRPPRKKAKAAAITARRSSQAERGSLPMWWREPATIVTAKNPHRRGRLPDMTPEEYQRRCDAADALWRELVRQATGKQ